MNIIHFIEKLFFLESELIEKVALPYMIILYLIDVFCTYRMYKKFNEPIWQAFIPFYNWKVYFEHCWNLKAFREHLLIEVCGLFMPFVISVFQNQIVIVILSLIDLFVACLGLKHGYEIGTFVLKSFGYDVKKYLWSIFVFDIVLILSLKGKYQGNKSHGH